MSVRSGDSAAPPATSRLDAVRAKWQAAWPTAVETWSPYVQLHAPTWCETEEDERRESLSGSFAMIRLVDHSVVVSLSQVIARGLADFALPILAHEAGHHVYCPGDLTDNARLLARTREGLPTCESYAPMIANLYADLLINDWLHRTAAIDMAAVYRRLAAPGSSRLWSLYLRTYETLWRLPSGSLGAGPRDERLEHDARLGARLVRSYAKQWLSGAGRFAALYLPYVLEQKSADLACLQAAWNDLRDAGRGGLPSGLSEIEDEERTGAIHPAEDPALTGLEDLDVDESPKSQRRTPPEASGGKSERTYRGPLEYAEILRASGATLDERQVAANYYRERATPHLVRFPVRLVAPTTEPFPEGLDVWDVGAPLSDVDWLQTLLASPEIVPGVTTRTRLYGETPGHDPHPTPFDLYLGVDCSGSMGDPARKLSYPVLAGAILAISALRVGAKVKVVLSGEPGRTISTDDFLRDQDLVLRTLVNYLGTGYAFGIHRLAETFDRPRERPAHVLVVSDHDLFSMLNEKSGGRTGWEVAEETASRCGGGATFVLELPAATRANCKAKLGRMESIGWNATPVESFEELVAFARSFGRRHFERTKR